MGREGKGRGRGRGERGKAGGGVERERTVREGRETPCVSLNFP